jgi:hypothetical protein
MEKTKQILSPFVALDNAEDEPERIVDLGDSEDDK